MKIGSKKVFLAVAISSLAIYGLFAAMKAQGLFRKADVQPELRIFTRYKIDLDRLEPATYGEASEYDFVSYLYSPLVQFDNQGQIVSGLSDRFYWEGSDLVFEIRKNAVTSKGEPITAHDVLFSIKRHHVLLPDQASQLFAEICDQKILKKVDEPCSGLISKDNKLIVRFKSKKPLYLDLFTSPDFAIVPIKAVDQSTLKVVDRNNTTGPYRIAKANGKDSFLRLEARKEHWLWKKNIPQKVLIKTFFDQEGKEISNDSMADLFFQDKFDLVPTYAAGRSAAFRIHDHNLKGYNIFRSLPISTYIIFFSDRAKAEYSAEERVKIGQLYRDAYYKNKEIWSHPYSPIQTNEFFPPSSEGSLTDVQKAQYAELITKANASPLHRPAVLHVVESYMQDNIDYIKESNGQLTYQNDDTYTYPPNKSFNQRFDGFFSLINASSIEGVDSIFWLRSMNWMPYSPAESDRWIERYLETDDKSARVALMKQLHFDMLTNGIVAPIKAQEYAAVSKGPWKMKFSKLFSSTPLWQIEYEP